MYKLTHKMERHLKCDLQHYHQLFDGGRCNGWEMEELIFRAIKSNSSAKQAVKWRENRKDNIDIEVESENQYHRLAIKSGRFSGRSLVVSGDRLGRYDGDFSSISTHLNSCDNNIICVAYQSATHIMGKRHYYQLYYIDQEYLKHVESDSWHAKGSSFYQTNEFGVEFKLATKLSWQIWWEIPLNLMENGKVITIP